MDDFGTVLGAKWPFLVALFCSCFAYVLVWTWFQRRWSIAAEQLTWGATALGVLIILAWLSALLTPAAWWTVALAFGVGGLPAVVRGVVLVVAYMADAPEVIYDETPRAR